MIIILRISARSQQPNRTVLFIASSVGALGALGVHCTCVALHLHRLKVLPVRLGPAMRIAISGAGVSGLTLAAILARRLPRTLAALGLPPPQISVFERAPADRDQGSVRVQFVIGLIGNHSNAPECGQ